MDKNVENFAKGKITELKQQIKSIGKDSKQVFKELEKQSEAGLKAIAKADAEFMLPSVYITVDGNQLRVLISPEDFHKGKDEIYRKKVDKVFSQEDRIRYDWLYFWHTNGGTYPKEYDKEFENFADMYGTPYKDFLRAYHKDHGIYAEAYAYDSNKYEALRDKIIKEYDDRRPSYKKEDIQTVVKGEEKSLEENNSLEEKEI